MESQAALLRLKEFQLDGQRRKVAQIETMIADLERLAGDLDRDIRVEEDRSGIHDPAHYAYPTFAKAAVNRRNNLRRPIGELNAQLDAAKDGLRDAIEQIETFAMIDERERMNVRPRYVGGVRRGPFGDFGHG